MAVFCFERFMLPKKKGGKKVKPGDKLTFLLSPSYFEILGDWIELLDELLYAGVSRTMFLGLCSFRPQIRPQRSQMTFLESTGAKQSLGRGGVTALSVPITSETTVAFIFHIFSSSSFSS